MCAAVITDNVYGPASNIGNLYFASWIGFSLSVMLAFTSLKELFSPADSSSQESESNVDKSSKGEGENVVRQDVGDQVEGESGEA